MMALLARPRAVPQDWLPVYHTPCHTLLLWLRPLPPGQPLTVADVRHRDGALLAEAPQGACPTCGLPGALRVGQL